MQLLGYVALLILAYPLSILPLRILYVIADVTFCLVFYVFRYRWQVVMDNLRRSFPDKSDAEIRVIAKRFYRYLCTLTFEGFKTLTISKRRLVRRAELEVPKWLDAYRERGQNVVIVTAHYGNWEWGSFALALMTRFKAAGVFLPHRNPYVTRGMVTSRQRFGGSMIIAKDVRRFLAEEHERPLLTAFVVDQSPGNPMKSHWVDFMGRQTAFSMGPAKLAVRLGYPVVFGWAEPMKRGSYRIELEVLEDNPTSKRPEEITQAFAARLEKLIRRRPEFWLWSHRRWKHSKD